MKIEFADFGKHTWGAIKLRWPESFLINDEDAAKIIQGSLEAFFTGYSRRGRALALGIGIPPSIEQIQAYFKVIGFAGDAADFFDYYETVGWVVGRDRPMKNWQAACRLWKSRAKGNQLGRPKKASFA